MIKVTLAAAALLGVGFITLAVIAPGNVGNWEAYAAPFAMIFGVSVSLAGALVAIRLAEIAVRITDRQAFADAAQLVRDTRQDLLEMSAPVTSSLEEAVSSIEALTKNIEKFLPYAGFKVTINDLQNKPGPERARAFSEVLRSAETWYEDPANRQVFDDCKHALRQFVDVLVAHSGNKLAAAAWSWRINRLQETRRLPRYLYDTTEKDVSDELDIVNLAKLVNGLEVRETMEPVDLVRDLLWICAPRIIQPGKLDNMKVDLYKLASGSLLARPLEFAGLLLIKKNSGNVYGHKLRKAWTKENWRHGLAPNAVVVPDGPNGNFRLVRTREGHSEPISYFNYSDYYEGPCSGDSHAARQVRVYHIAPLVMRLAGIALLPSSSADQEAGDDGFLSELLAESERGGDSDPIVRSIRVPSVMKAPQALLPAHVHNLVFDDIFLGDWDSPKMRDMVPEVRLKPPERYEDFILEYAHN